MCFVCLTKNFNKRKRFLENDGVRDKNQHEKCFGKQALRFNLSVESDLVELVAVA